MSGRRRKGLAIKKHSERNSKKRVSKKCVGSEQEEPRASYSQADTVQMQAQSWDRTLSRWVKSHQSWIPGIPSKGPGHRRPTEPASARLVLTVPSSCCCGSQEGLPAQEEDSTGVPLAFREASVPTRAKPLFFSHTKPPAWLPAPAPAPPPAKQLPFPPTLQPSCSVQPSGSPIYGSIFGTPWACWANRTRGGEGPGSCAEMGVGGCLVAGPAHLGLSRG